MTARWALLWVASVACAFVLGWAVARERPGGALAPGSGPRAATGAGIPKASRARAGPTVPPATLAPAPPAPAPAASEGRAAEAGVAGLPDGAPTPRGRPLLGAPSAWVVVSLGYPGGWRARGGRVYALPAGARGARGFEAAPTVDAEGDGPWRLPLPAAGRWDVGFVCDLGAVLLEDVVVDEGGEAHVRLSAPGAAPVHVEIVGAPARLPSVHVRIAGQGEPVSLPGRGQRAPVAWSTELGETAGASPPIEGGRPLRAQAWLDPKSGEAPWWRLVAESKDVEAGETVRLCLVHLGHVRVRFRVGSEGGPHGVAPSLRSLTAPDGPLVWCAVIPDAAGSVVLAADPGTYRLAWTGQFVADGHVDGVRIAPGETTDLAVDLVAIPDRYAPYANVPDFPLRVRGTVESRGQPGREVVVAALVTEEVGAETTVESTGFDPAPDASPEVEWRDARLVVARQGPWRAGGPFAGPFSHGIDVSVEPGGLLLVAPETVTSAHLGRLRVRRVDGAPFFAWRQEDGELQPLEPGVEMEVDAGTILGPFPAGRVSFEVRLGGARFADARATVLPDRLEVLRLTR